MSLDRRTFLSRLFKGIAIAAISPEVIVAACEKAGIAKGTGFSFGNISFATARERDLYEQQLAAEFFRKDPGRLYGAIARALSVETPYLSVIEPHIYRGIEFREDQLPFRGEWNGMEYNVSRLWRPVAPPADKLIIHRCAS